LRNPFRWSFDKNTGDAWIGDVGQESWEEINFKPAGSSGLNFGWDCYEGNAPYEITLIVRPADQLLFLLTFIRMQRGNQS
jgi:hypothetical protein